MTKNETAACYYPFSPIFSLKCKNFLFLGIEAKKSAKTLQIFSINMSSFRALYICHDGGVFFSFFLIIKKRERNSSHE